MANRIEQWWREFQKWKERTHQLLQPSDRGTNLIKKEELRNYEKMLNKRFTNLNPEEKESLRRIKIEKKILEKQLYPNSFHRLFRNAAKLVLSSVSLPFKMVYNTYLANQSRKQYDELARKHDLNPKSRLVKNSSGDVEKKREISYSESNHPGEVIDYTFKYAVNNKGELDRTEIYARLNFPGKMNGNEIRLTETDGLKQEHIRELLYGRPVNTTGNKWLVPDTNDRDSFGNLKIKELSVNHFNLAEALRKMPLVENRNLDIAAVCQQLLDGKSAQVSLKIDGKNRFAELQANPIKHSLDVYLNGKKVGFDRIGEQTKKVSQTKFLNLKPDTGRHGKKKWKIKT